MKLERQFETAAIEAYELKKKLETYVDMMAGRTNNNAENRACFWAAVSAVDHIDQAVKQLELAQALGFDPDREPEQTSLSCSTCYHYMKDCNGLLRGCKRWEPA